MQNNTQIDRRCQLTNTWLQIQFQDDITADLGNIIPYPHHHYFKDNKPVYCWLISGWFSEPKAIKYLNDIIARFKITYIDRCKYLKHSKDSESSIRPYILKEFQGLKSKAKAILRDKYSRVETHQDYVFMCVKLYAEDLIRADGLIIYDNLENWAFDNFIDKAKDKSTLRAKCRSVYNWYFDRNWQIGRVRVNKTSEEIMATRQEQGRYMADLKSKEAREKIENAITGLLADSMFKKKNGSWNAVAIAEYLSLDPRTVRKHLPKI